MLPLINADEPSAAQPQPKAKIKQDLKRRGTE
jgi:hypothetical protein